MKSKGLLILLGIGLLILWRTKEAKAAVIPEERKKTESAIIPEEKRITQYPPPPPGFYIAEIIPFRRIR